MGPTSAGLRTGPTNTKCQPGCETVRSHSRSQSSWGFGYTGYLKPQLDWDLLCDLTVSHPGWHFVFVGPVRKPAEVGPILDALGRQPNAHFPGSKEQNALAAYSQHFDLCIMPYVADAYTKYIYPLKLH